MTDPADVTITLEKNTLYSCYYSLKKIHSSLQIPNTIFNL